jgi:hypothetical protein
MSGPDEVGRARESVPTAEALARSAEDVSNSPRGPPTRRQRAPSEAGGAYVFSAARPLGPRVPVAPCCPTGPRFTRVLVYI